MASWDADDADSYEFYRHAGLSQMSQSQLLKTQLSVVSSDSAMLSCGFELECSYLCSHSVSNPNLAGLIHDLA